MQQTVWTRGGEDDSMAGFVRRLNAQPGTNVEDPCKGDRATTPKTPFGVGHLQRFSQHKIELAVAKYMPGPTAVVWNHQRPPLGFVMSVVCQRHVPTIEHLTSPRLLVQAGCRVLRTWFSGRTPWSCVQAVTRGGVQD